MASPSAYGDGTVGFDANGNPAGERYFELTRKPTYVADETIAQLGYPTEAVTSKVAWNSTTPAQRLGLNNGSTAVARSHALLPASKNLTGEGVSTGAADRRPAVKIEYYVPDWNKPRRRPPLPSRSARPSCRLSARRRLQRPWARG